MVRKVLQITVFLCALAALIPILNLQAALYEATMRLINSTGFVIDGTASATTANYDHTCRVVNQLGTVLDPGTASGVSANYDCTIRVVDHNGFVQSAIGGTAAPTATIAPYAGFTVAPTAASTMTVSYPTAMPTNAYLVCALSTGNNVQPTWPNGTNFAPLSGTNGFSAGNFFQLYGHCILPGETGFSVNNIGSTTTMCCEAYQHVTCNTDTPGLLSGGNTLTAPAYTTSQPDDFVLHVFGTTNNQNATWTAPAGDTVRAQVNSASTTSNGCLLSDRLQASATTVPSAAASTSVSSADVAYTYSVTQGSNGN